MTGIKTFKPVESQPKKIKHFMYCPWTGLGLYNGFRGNRWLKNRIYIFKQFVLPSLQQQTSQNFTLWCSWRPQEKRNPIVQEFVKYLEGVKEFKTVHTFHGVCFWDDKYKDVEANDRLLTNLHGSLGDLVNHITEDYVLMTIQPSDDVYRLDAIENIQKTFESYPEHGGFGYTKGYVMNYQTKELKEWNPTTNPPFYTIKFDKETFVDPLRHAKHIGPYKSHEFVGDFMKYGTINERGFIVGTHGENISTVFDHPFTGNKVSEGKLAEFGILTVPNLKIKQTLRRRLLRKLSYKTQRKLRYIFGEKLWKKIYELLRN